MKSEEAYKDCIRDIGLDPFFIHFYTPDQVHLYKAYSRNSVYLSLIIDATGTIVKKFSQLGLVKTQTIYLYEAVVYDDLKNHTFTVCSMVSEKHDNIAIFRLLSRWLKSNIPTPKETISDMSLALLTALVRSFTQYTYLNDYINACSLLILGNASHDSFLLSRCFIRIDVAHFIKNLTNCIASTTVSKRVKEIYLRAICIIIQSKNLSEIRSLLLSIFVVASNESVGYSVDNGLETPCLVHKKKLIESASSGFVCLESEFNEILSTSTNLGEGIEITELQNDDIHRGLEEEAHNLFKP